MKAVRFHRYGGPEVLQYEDAPLPEVAADDVLIRVHAAGVNPADWKFRAGWYAAHVPRPLPFIPGSDVAGIVERVGSGVTGFRPGDAVFAMADMNRNGAYADYVAVRAADVAAAPRGLPLEQAAGVPLAALTAWLALFDVGGLVAGQTVLVHAGAGGVGSFAVQLARHAGARVIATASAASLALVEALGAHQVIDYRAQDFTDAVHGVDLVLDTVGGPTQAAFWSVLRQGGMLVGVALPPDADAAARHRVRAAPAWVTPHGPRLVEIARLLEAGVLKVNVAREFALADAAAAHAFSETGRARGKIILRVA